QQGRSAVRSARDRQRGVGDGERGGRLPAKPVLIIIERPKEAPCDGRSAVPGPSRAPAKFGGDELPGSGAGLREFVFGGSHLGHPRWMAAQRLIEPLESRADRFVDGSSRRHRQSVSVTPTIPWPASPCR